MQMRYLASQFSILSLAEAVERMKRDNVPENAIVITFDDGYKDNYTNAFPILKGLSIPATIFLTTDAISSEKPIWHDNVFNAFRKTKVDCLEKFGDPPKTFPLRTTRNKIETLYAILQFLRDQDVIRRQLWIEQLLMLLHINDQFQKTNIMMTWEDVKEMHQHRISFGSHTSGHPILSRVTPEIAKSEIRNSKIAIEKCLGTSVTTFAYPNGQREDFNEGIKDILRDEGYTCAMTTIFGTNESGHDLFELRRGVPWEKDLPTFAFKMNWYKYRNWE